MSGKGRGYGRGTDWGSDAPKDWAPQARPFIEPKGRGRVISTPATEDRPIVFENRAFGGGFGTGFGGGAGATGFGATSENKNKNSPLDWPIAESLGPQTGFGSSTATASGGSNTFGSSGFTSAGFGGGSRSTNQEFGSGSGGYGGGFRSTNQASGGFGSGFQSASQEYGSGGFGNDKFRSSNRGVGRGSGFNSGGFGGGADRPTGGFNSGGFGGGAGRGTGGFNSGGFGGGADRPTGGFNSGGFGGGADRATGGFTSGGFGGGGADRATGGFNSSGFSSGGGFGASGFGGGGASYGGGADDDDEFTVMASSSGRRPYGSSGFKKSKGGFGGEGDLGYASAKKDLPPILKSFYVEDPEVASMTDEEVVVARLGLNNVAVRDINGDRKPPNPVKTFLQAFRAYPEIIEQIELQNFRQPTPIQCQMWPLALSGFDVIGIAQTGTGKTLGFLLPIFIHLEKQPGNRKREDGPGAVVVTPTRELAQQIHHEVKKYRYKGIKSVCIYGGAGNRQSQIKACEEGMDIVIATPGRLQDLSSNDVIDLSTVTFVVLDEADRMLDMGFEPDIRSLMMDIRDDRQTILTSATWPEAVRSLATSYTKDPFLITVGSLDLSAVHTVKQQVFVLEHQEKRDFLLEFLNKMKGNEKVIIFVATKRSVDYLANYLSGRGLKCAYMHGDRDQVDREKALKDLKKGHVRIMVATDVASRGLDISDITHVFNYDFPSNIEEYVHRVGRTGRAGKAGVAITLMTRSDWHLSTKLISILMEANQDVPEDLSHLSEQYEEQKTLLGPEAVNPPLRRRREERENRRRVDHTMFDPYTGEAL